MKPFADWVSDVNRIEQEERTAAGLSSQDRVPSSNLVAEIVRLSDAWAVEGLDVVIPGTREDLVRLWVRHRLAGRGETHEDWIALAQEVAPLPDEHLVPFTDRDGKTRYRSGNKSLDAITRAAEEYFGSKKPSD